MFSWALAYRRMAVATYDASATPRYQEELGEYVDGDKEKSIAM